MKNRIISGTIGFLLLITIVIKGGFLLNLSVLIVGLIGLYEFDKTVRKINVKPLIFLNYFITIILFILMYIDSQSYILFSLIVYFFIIMLFFVLNKNININDIGATIFSEIYIAFLLFHIILLNGNIMIWLVFITAWATDTFAYFTGMLFGKRKLCPHLSPKKTIEGAIGGILGSLIVTLLFVKYIGSTDFIKFALLAVIASLFAQIGDLTASKIKRICGVKDYGNIMPGHGGVLDRFDSILYTAPIVYYFIKLLL
ncbi:phosphatidate cytidylyltransferase [Caloranaerobacter azorensis]|uniref:Phosphatidate cytidylyltransferase n=3 Tax=Caloranaerobacter azorensis TaxID=116090 RepID=A0A1M5VF60_9FIRM|nr:phosphatidate cytidylyltransferase [Caloranaerobacter azorensis]KGG80837.1 phosphatidate cytidylyltransferase [Caloranaerobacter azorensis H53214]QIB26160.1 phosphatidate cytidylyltransferase [Caloranaerobacter azorensis]SHH73543.1 phosphatidate cytidylyltransferase [Caloranaerobacter azorensis DSM 13643]